MVQRGPTCLYSDSQSAIRLTLNPEFHNKTKHIDIKYHFTREQVELFSIILKYIQTNDQVADLLTKALSPDRFKRLRSMLTLVALREIHPFIKYCGNFFVSHYVFSNVRFKI